MDKTIKLLVADDHQLFRKGLINMLKDNVQIEVVAEAADGNEVLDHLTSGIECDLILLDVNMPNLNGVETMVKINRRSISIPVLMLSMEENERTIIQLIKLGIRGYVLKDASYDHLIEAITTAAQNQYYMNEVMSANYSLAMNEESHYLGADVITDREIEFLRLAATDMTYKEIATAMDVAPRTVDTYREALFHKLDVKNRVALVIWGIKAGHIQLN